MNEYISIALDGEPDQESIAQLNELLRLAGASADIYRNEHYNYLALTIKYDKEVVEQKRTRGAGRNKMQSDRACTYGQVLAMLKENTAQDVAAYLGMSRATLFRRLKEYKKNRRQLEEIFT